MKHTFPKHPGSSESLTVSEVREGTPFAVVLEEEIVKTGIFMQGTEYTDDGWAPVPALIKDKVEELSLYDIGVACDRYSGDWPATFTILHALER